MSVHRDGPSTPGRSPRVVAAISAAERRPAPGECRLQITAGAERCVARAGEDADQCGVVGAEAVPGIDQLAMCLRPNGIHALRAG